MFRRTQINALAAPFRAVFSKRRAAGVVRALSGSTSGSARTRRGSILVLVLGTLALMAILAILYSAIGTGDRRTGAAVVRNRVQDDVPEQVRDYVAGVLARDVLSVTPVRTGVSGGNPEYGLMREAWDHPWTDPQMVSIVADRTGSGDDIAYRFRPEGSYPLADTSRNRRDPDPRQGSDPWLASEEPENLDFNDDGIWGLNSGGTGGGGPGAGVSLDDQRYAASRDWRQMSNFAPDGRAVNLFNLRNNFNVPSGIGPDTISDRLVLYDDRGNPTESGNNAELITGAPALENIPAHWFSNVRAGAKATTETDGFTWDDALFPRYQFADADGDGITDSRWVELVDASLLDFGSAPDEVKSVISVSDDIRYFFAFKAVDLSARVNVNTATDFTRAPEQERPAGFTPADIDLRRLLSLEDLFTYGSGGVDAYNLLDIPRNASGQPIRETPENYEEYAFDSDGTRELLGDRAYDNLRFAIERGIIPPQDVFDDDGTNTLLQQFNNTYFSSLATDPNLLPNAPTEWEPSPLGRINAYLDGASNQLGIARTEIPGASNQYYYNLANPFGIDSLLELLTYNSVNDPDTLSPLEAAIDGRFNDRQLLFGLGPMRSNRGLSVERGDRDGYDSARRGNPSSPDGVADYDAILHLLTDVRHRLTTISGARSIASTVVVPDAAGLSAGANGDDLVAQRTDTLTTGEYRSTIAGLASNTNALFAFYAGQLAPYTHIAGAWDPSSSVWPSVRTLFYGYDGPERALRAAAHMTANMGDALDVDELQTAYTLLLDEAARTPLNSDSGAGGGFSIPLENRQFKWSWWDNRPLDLANGSVVPPMSGVPAVLADSNNGDAPTSAAINIYGIEAQPFITEVAMFQVYTDAPEAAGGDDEWNQVTQPPPGFGGGSPLTQPDPGGDPSADRSLVTIDPSVDPGNPDFLFQMVAVQVTNPFDRQIRLGRPSNPYYIEFNGRYYMLGGISLVDNGGVISYPGNRAPQDIILPAGETKTFVFASQPLDEIQARLADCDPTGNIIPDTANNRIDVIGQFLKNQFAIGGDLANVVLMPEVNPAAIPDSTLTMTGVDSDSFFQDLFQGGDAEEIRLWRVLRTPQTRNTTGEIQISLGGAPANNAPENDLLIDRLRVPNGASLERSVQLSPVQNKAHARGYLIPDAYAEEENVASNQNWNQGLTFVTWARAQRPDDPNAPGRSIPAYCLEGKWSTSWNFREEDSLPPGTIQDLDRSWFRTGNAYPDAYFTFNDFVEDVIRPAVPSPLQPDVGGQPGVRQITKLNERPETKNDPTKLFSLKPTINDRNLEELRLELHIDLDADLLRPTDLLLPMATGAVYDPFAPAGGDRDETLNNQWITLGESLALAIGYDNPTNIADPLYNAGKLLAKTADPYVDLSPGAVVDRGFLDRGHIVLNDFVPFLADTGAPAGSPPNRFDPESDLVFGLGVPPAMALLDRVRGMAEIIPDPTEVIPGVININTATSPVARTIPLLSPTRDVYPAQGEQPVWWWQVNRRLGPGTDIAATLLGYRDLTQGFPRLDFSPTGAITTVALMFGEPRQGSPGILSRRQSTPMISGLRADIPLTPGLAQTVPGFRTPGELLALTVKDPNERLAPDGSLSNEIHNIDRMGSDGLRSIEQEGIDPLRYNNGADDDGIPDDFDEQLAILAASLNTTSVRTDYIAVWFLMHGYRESDVTGLQPGEPMLPSVQRRFLMVVDRSEVERVGDQPRIVLFREVPL
ncbi:MAG: hypothetical protein ACF8SC_13075 [Phycisphaerales bacterium JB037]